MYRFVISGVYKSSQDIEHMFLNGVKTYTIESLTQFELLCEQCQKHHQTIDVLLRLTSGNQFGMCPKRSRSNYSQSKTISLFAYFGYSIFFRNTKNKCQKLDELITYLKQVEVIM